MSSNLIQRAESLRQNPSITELIEIVVQLAKDIKQLKDDGYPLNSPDENEQDEKEVKRGIGRPKKNS